MEDSHFDEQEESIRLMEQHRDLLVADAQIMRKTAPHAQLVGVVFSPASSEARKCRAEMAKAGKPMPATAGIVMVMLRAAAIAVLRATAPAQLDWLESGPDKLPLLCATEHGVRLGWAPMPPE